MAVLTTPPPGYAAHIAGMVVEEPGAEMGPFEVSRSSAGLAEFLQPAWLARDKRGTNELGQPRTQRGCSGDERTH